MEESTSQPLEKKSGKKGIFVAIFVIIIILAIIGYETTKPKDDTTQSANSAPATTAPKKTDEAEVMTASTYKNGTYNATGNYTSPGGPEEIDVTITLDGDVITAAEVVSKAERPISKEKQAIFIENFEPMVVGKNIDEVQLDKVSSSSLTPKGFNDAVEKVKEEAKA